jgi:hypothetical protein
MQRLAGGKNARYRSRKIGKRTEMDEGGREERRGELKGGIDLTIPSVGSSPFSRDPSLSFFAARPDFAPCRVIQIVQWQPRLLDSVKLS